VCYCRQREIALIEEKLNSLDISFDNFVKRRVMMDELIWLEDIQRNVINAAMESRPKEIKRLDKVQLCNFKGKLQGKYFTTSQKHTDPNKQF